MTTGAEVALREAAGRDLDDLTALVAGAGLPTVGLSSAWRTWVAVQGGEVVGGCALERHEAADRAPDTRPAHLLRSVVTSPPMRGRGLGGLLVRRALATVDADGGGPVALLTETAVGYFERFGFRSVPRDALPVALSASEELRGACPASAHAYLRLTPLAR